MSVKIIYSCDSGFCPTTVTRVLPEPGALVTPAGWIVLGDWRAGYLHACSSECAALLTETRGVRPIGTSR